MKAWGELLVGRAVAGASGQERTAFSGSSLFQVGDGVAAPCPAARIATTSRAIPATLLMVHHACQFVFGFVPMFVFVEVEG
jgi:hypothetical protein